MDAGDEPYYKHDQFAVWQQRNAVCMEQLERRRYDQSYGCACEGYGIHSSVCDAVLFDYERQSGRQRDTFERMVQQRSGGDDNRDTDQRIQFQQMDWNGNGFVYRDGESCDCNDERTNNRDGKLQSE